MPLKDIISGEVDILYFDPMNSGLTVDVAMGSAYLRTPVNCDDCTNKQLDTSKSSAYKIEQEFEVTYVCLAHFHFSSPLTNPFCVGVQVRNFSWRCRLDFGLDNL
jgi:hypothetical protein